MSGTSDEVNDGFHQNSNLAHVVSYIDTARRQPVGDLPRRAALRCILDLLPRRLGDQTSPAVAARKTLLATMAAG